METGYFGNTRGNVSRTHIVDENRKPLCRYRPVESMQFQLCANGVHIGYTECEPCLKRAARLSNFELYGIKSMGRLKKK
jgi:hypothetical protein